MPELKEILVSVWRQTFVDGAKYVRIGEDKYPVRETSRRRLKQVDFRYEDHELRGLEQNPDTKSKWAAMSRQGKKVMQFLDGGRYVAVVVDGKTKTYCRTHFPLAGDLGSTVSRCHAFSCGTRTGLFKDSVVVFGM